MQRKLQDQADELAEKTQKIEALMYELLMTKKFHMNHICDKCGQPCIGKPKVVEVEKPMASTAIDFSEKKRPTAMIVNEN